MRQFCRAHLAKRGLLPDCRPLDLKPAKHRSRVTTTPSSGFHPHGFGGRPCKTSAALCCPRGGAQVLILKVGKRRDNVLVRHSSVGVPRHDLVELPCPDKPRADCLGEHGLVILRNPQWVRCDVAGRAASRSIENEPASKVHARKRLPMCVLRRVAIRASSNCHQVFPALFRTRNIGFRHWCVQRLGHVADQVLHRENELRRRLLLVHRWQRP